jgi:glycerophosphoryl diester phosphodiesterase
MPELIRVGHKGADGIVAGNTLASFDAALEAGVDMIEFDVLAEQPDGTGELLVVHDYRQLRRHGAPTLADVLVHLASPPFSQIRLQVDLKQGGYEEPVVDALRSAGVVGRSFISTGHWPSLQRVRAIAPELSIGWTVASGIAGAPLVGALIAPIYRSGLPRAAAGRIRAGAIDAVVPERQLVSRSLVKAVRAAGGEIYVWTVDDATEIARLAALGVSGVITNDPRLFERAAALS